MPTFKPMIATVAALLGSTALSTAYAGVKTGSYTAHVTYSASPPWGNSINGSGFTPTHTMNFAAFNTSLGSLTKVSFTATETMNGFIKIHNTSSTQHSGSATAHNTFKFAVPDVSLKTQTLSKSHAYNLVGGASTNISITGSTSNSFKATSGLSSYLTAWTAKVGDYASTSTTNGFPGTATFGGTSKVEMVVTYNYQYTTGTPVPEPGSFALLGGGLVGLGVLRRRRSR